MIIIMRDVVADTIGPDRARELLALPATVVIFLRSPERGHEMTWEHRGWDEPFQIKQVGGQAEQAFVAIEMLRSEYGDDTMVFISTLAEDSIAAVLADVHFAGSLEEASASFIEEAYHARGPESRPTPDNRPHHAPLAERGVEAGTENPPEREGPDTT